MRIFRFGDLVVDFENVSCATVEPYREWWERIIYMRDGLRFTANFDKKEDAEQSLEAFMSAWRKYVEAE